MSKILNMLMAFVMSFGISGSNVNPSDIPENSNFEVHFIDVGQADSALIECDGETMMIDGGNVADSNVVAAYLKKEDVTELNYVVCSHAHEDHVGGLSGALSVKQRRIQRHIKISRKKPKNKMLKSSTRMSVTKFSLAAVRLNF